MVQKYIEGEIGPVKAFALAIITIAMAWLPIVVVYVDRVVIDWLERLL